MGNTMLLMIITFFVIAIGLIVGILLVISRIQNKKYKQELEKLERNKNLILDSRILSELSKAHDQIKNDKMQAKYDYWNGKVENIKSANIPVITDMLIEADELIENKKYKEAVEKFSRIELEIYKIKSKTNKILENIKNMTASEENNRTKVIKLKTKYRELLEKYNETEKDFGEISNSIKLQFENIEKRFTDFESQMEKNNYDEVERILCSIEDMLGYMQVVLDEVPTIILMVKSIIPKKEQDLSAVYKNMEKDGYVIDYLNIDYNIEETNKKLVDIYDRTKSLNLEDCVFELKTISEYIDSLFGDIEKEKEYKRKYETEIEDLKKTLNKITTIMNDIYKQFDDIQNTYDLKEEEIDNINKLYTELCELSNDYKLLTEHGKEKSFAYSKLYSEIESLSVRLGTLENNFDEFLSSIGSMKEDETRARGQLEEIILLLKKAHFKTREYKLPVIPNNYYVELQDAKEAIKEIVKELSKKPISIKTLNTRVDTARDLVFKLYNTTEEMIRNAILTETSIVYGNRYRTTDNDIKEGLDIAENLFLKGDYKKSLEIAVNTIDLVEPGVYKKIKAAYENDVK